MDVLLVVGYLRVVTEKVALLKVWSHRIGRTGAGKPQYLQSGFGAGRHGTTEVWYSKNKNVSRVAGVIVRCK